MKMDDFEVAQDIVKSIHDAETNEFDDLAAVLRSELAEINARIVNAGFSPVEA